MSNRTSCEMPFFLANIFCSELFFVANSIFSTMTFDLEIVCRFFFKFLVEIAASLAILYKLKLIVLESWPNFTMVSVSLVPNFKFWGHINFVKKLIINIFRMKCNGCFRLCTLCVLCHLFFTTAVAEVSVLLIFQ